MSRAPVPGDNVRLEPAESPGRGLSATARRYPWPSAVTGRFNIARIAAPEKNKQLIGKNRQVMTKTGNSSEEPAATTPAPAAAYLGASRSPRSRPYSLERARRSKVS